MKSFGMFLFCFFSWAVCANDFTSRCNKFPSPLQGGYCIHTPVSEGSADVLYHLHGNGGSEFTWQEDWFYTTQLRHQWKQMGVKLPKVISISFGSFWLLAEKNSSAKSGLLEVLVSQVIPKIEAEIGGVKGRRLVLGESMGGMNTLQLAFKTKLFQKAAALCAPMAEVSLHAPQSEIESYLKTTTAWAYYKDVDPEVVPKSVALIVQLTKTFFPTEEEWQKADPLQLALGATKGIPAIYLAAGFYDKFALLEGNEKFSQILKSKGIDIDWRPQWGGHCAIDIPSLAAFLAND